MEVIEIDVSINMIILTAFFVLAGVLGFMSYYFGIKARSNLSEYGKQHRFKIDIYSFWVGEKYFNEKGLVYKKKRENTLILLIILILSFFLLSAFGLI